MGKMSEAAKARLHEIAAKRVRMKFLEPEAYLIACDFADDSPERVPSAVELERIKCGHDLRAPSYLPRAAVEVLQSRLPHVMVTLSAGPGKTRHVPAFYWPTLRLVYSFLGLSRINRRTGEPKLVTRPIDFRGCLPLEALEPSGCLEAQC